MNDLGFAEGFVLKDCPLVLSLRSPSHKEQQPPPTRQVLDYLYGLAPRQLRNFELLSSANLSYPHSRRHVNAESDAKSHTQVCDSLRQEGDSIHGCND